MDILLLFWRFLWRKPISYPAALPLRGEGHSSGDVWQRWDDNKNESSIPRELHAETKHDNKLDNSSQSKQYEEWTCCGVHWLMGTIKMMGGGGQAKEDKQNFRLIKSMLFPVIISHKHDKRRWTKSKPNPQTMKLGRGRIRQENDRFWQWHWQQPVPMMINKIKSSEDALAG